jgi:hypothetical protein
MCRVAPEGLYKIYFAFFGHSFKFLQILKIWTIFWYLTNSEKIKNAHTVPGSNRPTARGAWVKPVHVRWHGGLLRGPAHRRGRPASAT